MIQLINRPNYIERISTFINKNIIKVLTGQRRVGKSCILRQIQAHIEATEPNSNIISINKELEEFALIRNYEDLSQYISSRLKDGVANYLFIDEVQDITGFETLCVVCKLKMPAIYLSRAAMPQCYRANCLHIYLVDI